MFFYRTSLFTRTGSVTIKNLESHRQCNNMSRMNLSGYVGHVTIFG